MNKINEINDKTELIIQKLYKETTPPDVTLFAEKIKISYPVLVREIAVLQLYKVAEIRKEEGKHVKKLHRLKNFADVKLAGGLRNYLKQEEANKSVESELKSKVEELTELEILKIKKDIDSRITENQAEFYERIIKKLDTELSDKSINIQNQLQKEQSDFFTTSSQRNEDQMLYFKVMIFIGLLSLIVSSAALYYSLMKTI